MGKPSDLIIPTEASGALRALGQTISRARRARGDTQALVAERCGIHKQTVGRIERGDAAVGIGAVFSVLVMYGMGARLFELARDDEEALSIAMRALPKRGRSNL